MNKSVLASCALCAASVVRGWAALQPGPAQSSATNGTYTLQNNFLAVSWLSGNKNVSPLAFINNLTTQNWDQTGTELFDIQYTSTGGGVTSTVSVSSSNCSLVSGPYLQAVSPNTQSTRLGDRLPGQELVASFVDPVSGLQVDWSAVLRDGANYLRQFLAIYGGDTNDQITSVEMLDFATAATPVSVGVVPGSPVVAGQAFLGGETPFANSTLSANRVRLTVSIALPLGPNTRYDFSSVAGVFPAGQQRRSFLYYLERERAAPSRQLLAFDSWLDAGLSVSEAEMLAAINACESELHQRRGVAMDCYAIYDGWYNAALGFWAIDTNKFPHGFDLLQSNVTAVGAHLGLWISPMGGYAWANQLTQDAINQGLVTSNLDLSIPTYYAWWTNECATFIRSNGMNYFMWDRAGDGATPQFMAVLRAADTLHANFTNILINATVGTWPSPFWLNQVDSTWRGGQDSGMSGIGPANEQWITYRDGQVWQNVVQSAPLYPVTSLEVDAIQLQGADFRHEVRTFFGSGLNLQQLALTPSMMISNDWDCVAEAAAWARTNASVLIDSHWVGGDPDCAQVYGWAAWCPAKGTLTLRNPSTQTNCIALDIGKAFELPPDSATAYTLSTPYADQRPTLARLEAGQMEYLTLLPFEVLTFDVLPTTDSPQPPVVTMPLPMTRYRGGMAAIQAGVQGSLPMSFQWNSNNVPIPFATNATLVLSNLNDRAAGAYSLTASNALGTTTGPNLALTVLTPGNFGATILADHPLGWWPMNESFGPRIADGAGGHDGIAIGGVSFGVPAAPGVAPDTAIHFDGSVGTRIDVPYAPELNSARFSFECLARATGGLGRYGTPLASRDDRPSSGYLFYASQSNRWEFWTGSRSSWTILTGPLTIVGQWVHLVGTFDGTNQSFYVNGQLVGSVRSTVVPNVRWPLRIGGADTENLGYCYFNGDINQVAVYDYTLSAAQVQGHFSQTGIPYLSFTTSPTNGIVPLTVTLSDTSTASISNWFWNFGDGCATNLTNPTVTHVYATADVYSVTEVAGIAGKAWTNTQLNCITAALTSGSVNWSAFPSSGVAPLTVTFIDRSAANITNRFWNFGDGGTTSLASNTVTHTYGASGAYLVTETVSGPSGSSTSASNPGHYITVLSALQQQQFQAWQKYYFNCTNCPQAAMDADMDGSGQNNFFKFVAGLDPTNPASAFKLETQKVPGQPKYKQLTYQPIAAGRTYAVQSVTDLLAGAWSLLPTSSPLTNGARVTVTDPYATAPNKFYRVLIYSFLTNINPIIEDCVGDGIADRWRAQYFGGDGTTTNSQSCATCDVDGSGQNNFFKFVAGLDPTNPASVFKLEAQKVPGQPKYKQLTYQPIAAGRTYAVQSVTDLVTGAWSLLPTSSPITNGPRVTVTDPYATAPNKFYRVLIYSFLTNINPIIEDCVGDGIADRWRAQYFGGDGTTTNSQSCATCDVDGSGQNNFFKFVAGLDPTNPASRFQISSLARQTTDVGIVWRAGGDRTNAVQASGTMNGSNGFNDISPPLVLPAPGDVITNWVDTGGATSSPVRFYRIRLVP